MNTEELRAVIWDQIFRAKGTKSIDELAALTDQDASAVREAVSHDWFMVSEDQVSIAMAAPEPRDHQHLLL
jgi:hypothetical protein